MYLPLQGKNVAILVENGFEQVEMTEPRIALEKAGADTSLISPQKGHVKAWKSGEWGDTFKTDVILHDADPTKYDALLIPGGVMSPDKLRMNADAVDFVRAFFIENKPFGEAQGHRPFGEAPSDARAMAGRQGHRPVAAICHGPWMLIEADVVDGRILASWPSLRTDLENAGADWIDEEVVVDNGVITSRKPDDIPAFTAKMIEEFAEGQYLRQFAT
jgi:protease I